MGFENFRNKIHLLLYQDPPVGVLYRSAFEDLKTHRSRMFRLNPKAQRLFMVATNIEKPIDLKKKKRGNH